MSGETTYSKRKGMSVGSVTPTLARKIVNFAFGDSLIKLDPIPEEKRYDVYVKDDVDMEVVQDFEDVWGEGWNIIVQRNIRKRN